MKKSQYLHIAFNMYVCTYTVCELHSTVYYIHSEYGMNRNMFVPPLFFNVLLGNYINIEHKYIHKNMNVCMYITTLGIPM